MKRTVEIDQIRKIMSEGKPFFGFSDRELEVILGVYKGATNKEIAFALGLKHGTVRNYVSKIITLLGVRNRVHVALYAERHNLTQYLLNE